MFTDIAFVVCYASDLVFQHVQHSSLKENVVLVCDARTLFT